MCGIAGLIDKTLSATESKHIVMQMLNAMTHRGPEGVGFVWENGVALGHRLLAFQDVAHAAQPRHDPTGSICITFNGEIFNITGLRSRLLRSGVQLSSRTDTEVILELY